MGDLLLGHLETLKTTQITAPEGTGSSSVAARHPNLLTRFDFTLLGSLLVLVVPAFKLAHLPLRFDVAELTAAYWGGTGLQAVFLAINLAMIGLPLKDTVRPGLARYREEKVRILISLALVSGLICALGFNLGFIAAVEGLCVAELMRRKSQSFESALMDMFVPALYLFVVITLVFTLNHAMAGMEFVGAYDPAFAHLDRVVFHANVSQIAHWSLSHLPLWVFKVLELAYFSLFNWIGATLILTALLAGRRYALLYVRTLFVGYVLAMIVFFIWPAKGPYLICPIHLASYPQSLPTFWTQETLLAKSRMLWAHTLTPTAARVNLVDYYISFPSMHAALPLIAVWFLRRWKKMALCLLAVHVGLILPATILLEWHYIVDLLGGFLVAVLAIWIAEAVSARQEDEIPNAEPAGRLEGIAAAVPAPACSQAS